MPVSTNRETEALQGEVICPVSVRSHSRARKATLGLWLLLSSKHRAQAQTAEVCRAENPEQSQKGHTGLVAPPELWPLSPAHPGSNARGAAGHGSP